LDPGVLTSAYLQELAKRPIPDVAVVAPRRAPLEPPDPKRDYTLFDEDLGDFAGELIPLDGPPPIVSLSQPPPPRPAAPSSARPSVPLDLGPPPEVTAATTVEEILLIVKQRLERLYVALGRSN
jgi:hypothetical protein